MNLLQTNSTNAILSCAKKLTLVQHFKGMANSGPNKNGCQFYITTMESPWLNGKHTIFGKVVKGASFVHVIEKVSIENSIIDSIKQFNEIYFRLLLMMLESRSKIL